MEQLSVYKGIMHIYLILILSNENMVVILYIDDTMF